MMATRKSGWERRLAALVESARHKPYRLGRHDCAIFAAAAVEAVTGQKPAALEGAYRSKASALRMQRRYGHTLAEAVSAGLGIPSNPAKHARRGDLLLLTDAQGVEHLGVCVDSRGVTLQPRGIQFRPLGDFAAAWRIG